MRRGLAILGLLTGLAGGAAAQTTEPPTPVTPPVNEQEYRQKYKDSAHALIIGNSAYPTQGRWQRLNSPAADATELRRILNPYVTVDPHSRNDLNTAGMRTALLGFAQNVMQKKPRVALIYFSGHGITFGGQGLLLPTDAPGAFNSDFLRQVWTIDKLLDALDQTGAPVRILILDACRNVDPAGLAHATSGRPVLLASARLAQSDTAPRPSAAVGLPGLSAQTTRGILIAYSTGPGKTAADGGAGQHSLYTSHLLRLVGEPLPVQHILTRVSAEVADQAAQQQPWLSEVSLHQSIYFNPPVSRRDREAVWWSYAQKDPQAFLKKFIDDPEFRYSVYRPAAEALYRKLVDDGTLLPEVAVLNTVPVALTLPADRNVAVRDAESDRVVASIPRGATMTVDARSLFRDRITVVAGNAAVGSVRRRDLPQDVIPPTLGFDLQFQRDRAELQQDNAGDYLKFVQNLKQQRIRSIEVITSGDDAADNAMAVIRAAAVRDSIGRIVPDLAGKVRLSPNPDGGQAAVSRLVVLAERP